MAGGPPYASLPRPIGSWEIYTANIFDEHFNLSHDGLCCNPQDYTSKFTNNLPYDLPFEWFNEQIQVRGVPPVALLHLELMYAMLGAIQDIMSATGTSNSYDHAMLTRLEDYMTETSSILKERDTCIKKREKVRRNYRNNMDVDCQHKPKEPNHFDRDVFLFGKKSYYYLFCSPRGIELRKSKQKLSKSMPH